MVVVFILSKAAPWVEKKAKEMEISENAQYFNAAEARSFAFPFPSLLPPSPSLSLSLFSPSPPTRGNKRKGERPNGDQL